MGTKYLFGYTRGKWEFNWKHVFISLNKRHNNCHQAGISIYSVLYHSMRKGLLNSNSGDISILAIQDKQASVHMQLK